jgi:Lon protease-like protein
MSPGRVPIFPLGTVLFPGGALPLKIFEQRYLEMTKACLKDNQPFGVCLIREGRQVAANHLISAAVESIPPDAPVDAVDPLCREVLQAIVDQVGAERFPAPLRLDDAAWVGYRLAEVLPLPSSEKQALLELTDAGGRLDRLRALLERQGLNRQDLQD